MEQDTPQNHTLTTDNPTCRSRSFLTMRWMPCSTRSSAPRVTETTPRVGRTQFDRSGKNGGRRQLLVDGRGAPLSLVVTGANEHDVTQLACSTASRHGQAQEAQMRSVSESRAQERRSVDVISRGLREVPGQIPGIDGQ